MRRPSASHPVWRNPAASTAAAVADASRAGRYRPLLMLPLLLPLLAAYVVLKLAQMVFNLPIAFIVDVMICLADGGWPKLPSWRRIRGWP